MRSLIVQSDQYGIDPLLDAKEEAISKLAVASVQTIGPAEALNPWLVAHDVYGSVEYFYVVLGYNGIGSIYDFVEGITIKLPSPTDVNRAIRQQAETKARITSI